MVSYVPDRIIQMWPEIWKDVEAIIDKYMNNDEAFNFSLGSLKSKMLKQ